MNLPSSPGSSDPSPGFGRRTSGDLSPAQRERELSRGRLTDAAGPERSPDAPPLPRLFLREPGWQVALKVGSERVFCYLTHPGETYYHRLADGELYLFRADVKICLPCADRQGLLHHEPRRLRPPSRDTVVGTSASASVGEDDAPEYQLREDRDRPLSDGAPESSFRPPRR